MGRRAFDGVGGLTMLRNTPHTQMITLGTSSPFPYRVRVIYPDFTTNTCKLSPWRSFKTILEAQKFVDKVESNLNEENK